MARLPVGEVEGSIAPLRRYARALTQDDVAADDLVQEALTRAYERAQTFRIGSAITPWLLSILHNVHAEGHRRAQTATRLLESHTEAQSPHIPSGQAEQAVILRQVAERFAALPEPQRAVLHLIAIEGLSYRQAADALGLPIGTVMSRLSRARASLRQADDDEPAGKLRLIGGSDAS